MHSNKELFNFDKCSNCKLVFLNPRLHLDDLKKYYTSYYLPYRGAQAWGKFEKFVASSQQKLDLKRVNVIKSTEAGYVLVGKRIKEDHLFTYC